MGFDGPFGSLPTQDIYELLKERISSFIGQQREKLDVEKKRKGSAAVSLGKEESGDPVVLACAMPWECGRRADGISRALCVHGKVSKTPQSLLKEGVIYCFQFIVVNKFLILSFPISSETEDN